MNTHCNINYYHYLSVIRSGLSETTFLDLHKVEGLRGIYIASQVHPSLGNHSSITLEHLTSKITFNWGVRWDNLNLTKPLISPKACENVS